MTDRYDKLRVSPDASRAEELRQRLHAELERGPLDDATTPRRRLTIAPSAGGAEFEPMEEMYMTDNSADNEHKHRWRTPAVAAAAIVVLGVGAIALSVGNTTADEDDAVSQTPAPTTAPNTAAPTTTEPPRTVTEIVTRTDPEITVTFTLPDGWEADDSPDGILVSGESSVVNLWEVDNVYADGCDWTMLDPPLGPTVDDLAEVWAELPGFTATTPVEITVDGYAGKQVSFTVPDYPTVADPVTGEDEADCFLGRFALWTEPLPDAGVPVSSGTEPLPDKSKPNSWAQVPGQQFRQWIIDVDGARLVINEKSKPGTTPEQLAPMDEFLASVEIS
jgi:hypothetical protein